ncbi:hypothetical protein [Paraburkholderia sp. BCC1885]|uniref:hypothetical protein n=1 Tax=Paraburkholderia sp. BCC1885 TaxID=2562669 RepID=UPI0011844276|nr:hypothetical protein [Paraburkholderia sp. BCC1885]
MNSKNGLRYRQVLTMRAWASLVLAYSAIFASLEGCQIPSPPFEALPPANEETLKTSDVRAALKRDDPAPASDPVAEDKKVDRWVDKKIDAYSRTDSQPANQSPTVQMLVDHISCELYRAVRDHLVPVDQNGKPLPGGTPESIALWKHIGEDNFVAAFDMTLTVTHNEGLNPSLAHITPLYSLTSSTFNRTLSAGGQLTLTQDRDIDINYVIDIGKLLGDKGVQYRCDGARADGGVRTEGGLTLGLEGDLGFEEILANGLVTAEATQRFNLYGSSGPKYAADTVDGSLTEHPPIGASQPPAGTAASSLTPHIESQLLGAFGELQPAAKPAAPAKAAKSAGFGAASAGGLGSTTVSFSSIIDFDLVWGLNAGYNWTLVHFKGPSGGGGGSGSGGSNGGSSGGGGSGSLINWSRSTMDSLSVTFTPTCRNDSLQLQDEIVGPTYGQNLGNGAKLDPTLTSEQASNAGISIKSIDLTSIVPARKKWQGPISFSDNTKSPIVFGFGGKQFPKGPSSGIVTWSYGYFDTATPLVALQGSITGIFPSSGNSAISLVGEQIDPTHFKWTATISTDIHKAFELDPSTANYWESIPGCSTITAGQVQGVVNNAQSQNLLIRLFRSNAP